LIPVHWLLENDVEGIAWLQLDVVGSRANVLSSTVLAELDDLLTAIVSERPQGVVFISNKPDGFIVGADIKEFQTVRSQEDALAIIKRGQAIMDRVESLPCPTAAAIHGHCLGGGLELALACDYRVASEEAATRLALPEVKLGIHPGFGGTMRSIRVLGALPALEMMLTGKNVDAQQARRLGLIDAAVPLRHLRSAARQLIESKPEPPRPNTFDRLLNSKPLRSLLAQRMRRRVAVKYKREHYPAPYALIELWRRYGSEERVLVEQEAASVAALSVTSTARSLVRVFMLQNRLKAAGHESTFQPRHVHVVGAGTMGGDIAAWTALQGFTVSVQDERVQCLTAAAQRASSLFTQKLKNRRQVVAAQDRFIPDEKGLGLRRADLIIEAIVEDLAVKQALYGEIEPLIQPDAMIATNTSSLSIDDLAAGLTDPSRLIGLHFFNPVARLPLVEVIPSTRTSEAVLHKALSFARGLDKLPLQTKNSPGFLVNRVLTPYLLEAMSMVDQGIPIQVVDKAAQEFGMPVGPLELADAVGLDIVLSAGERLVRAQDPRLPRRLGELVEAGRLGRKTGERFYRYKHGHATRSKWATYTDAALAEVQTRLVSRLVDEAFACLREHVVADADLVDAGLIFGAGFPPFRGGPLHYRSNTAHTSSR
jgi:3-hydroxyacyl-CoA dehydrogenase/enoyl-CoA hydratase/3-hydroxybutyryl-CoA epimerase